MALNYLLSPTFQAVSTAGKPLTGGYIETYLAGTRTKYFCASDFSGTLHPFKIPLDALGSNIVLADDGQSYDVYVYNRYGSLTMSRYNVNPSEGGGVSGTNITSNDGSITVTNTANGVDLSVTDNAPEVIVCSGNGSLTEDGSFLLLKDKGIGDSLYLVGDELYARPGWYNYEALVEIAWNGPMQNAVETVTVNCSGGMSQMVDLDLSAYRVETLNVSGTYHSYGEKFVCAVAGLPSNATARVLKLSVFRINSIVTAEGGGTPTEQVQSNWLETNEDEPSYIQNKPEELAASLDSGTELVAGQNITLTNTVSGLVISASGEGEKNVHRLLRYYTNAGDADAEHPVGDWLHDLDAEDPDDPSGHPMVTADQLFDWYEAGQNFELYEVDGTNGQLGWSAVYRMVTWQDQSAWWSQFAPVPGKACRLEFFRMGMYSTPYRGGLIAYIRYKDEDYMRLYDVMPGQSIWIAEYQEKLPHYASDWHAGDFLRVMPNGSDIEWTPLSTVASSGSYSDLTDKPSIPAAQVNSDWNASSGVAEILNKPTLAAVATSGSYTDLTDKPTIPAAVTVDQHYNASSANPQSGAAVAEALQTVPNELPSLTGNANKVLKVNSGATGVVWATESGGGGGGGSITVDQVYDATSTNAQSGTAVAGAVAGKQDALSTAQLNAANSGITANKVSGYDTHVADTDIHVTTSDKSTWNAKQDAISDLSTIRSGASAGATAVQPSSLATVATTGDYADLLNKPSIPAAVTVDQVYDSSSANPQSGVAVAGAVSGKQDALSSAQLNAANSGITSNKVSGYDTHVADTDIHVTAADKLAWNGKQDAIADLSTIRSGAEDGATAVQPADLATVATTGAYSDLSGTPDLSGYVQSSSLATVATTGDYDDLTNKPTIPAAVTVDQVYDSASANPQSGVAVASAVSGKQNALSTAQLNAANSGITSAKVTSYDTHVADTTIHVTSADKTAWSGKQDALTDITDVRVVASLPASPVATVLYLIPES